MKAYKGFGKDMKCRDFQFEEGKTYELPEGKKPKLCNNGFHACEAPIDCLKYYDPAHSVYHEVDLDGVTDETSDDTKRVGSKIKVGARLDIARMCSLQFEYIKEHCTNENNAEDGKPATAGSFGAATSRGSSSVGKNGLATARGNGVKVRGGMGAMLVIAIENDNDYDIKEWKDVVVDGEILKPDTWYTLKDGEWEEVADNV